MRKGWVNRKLGDVCSFQGGSQPPKSDFTKELKKDHVRLIQIRDYKSDRHVVYIPKNKARRFCNKDDIMIGRYGPPIFQILRGIKGAYNVALMKAIPKDGLITKDYLYYFLKNPDIQSYVIKLSSRAAGQTGLNKETLEPYPIYLPKSIKEQEEIVKVLNETFSLIDKGIINLETNIKNVRDFYQKQIDYLFSNENNWIHHTLGDVLEKTETIDPTKKTNEEFEYIDVSSVNKDTLTIEETTTIKGKDAPSRARKLIKTGDIIFATVRPTLKRIAIVSDEFDKQICSTGYLVLRTKPLINNKFVFYYLQTSRFLNSMEKLQKGTSYPAVTDNEVRQQIIQFPEDLKTQRSLVSRLDRLAIESKNLENIYLQKLKCLNELKKSILQKAFTGELKIKNDLVAV